MNLHENAENERRIIKDIHLFHSALKPGIPIVIVTVRMTISIA